MLVMNGKEKCKVMNGASKCNVKDGVTKHYMLDEDGTIWLCILYNNLQKGANTFKGHTIQEGLNTYLFVNDTCWCNTLLLKDCDHGDRYEILVTQQETAEMDTTTRHRWIQAVNPYEATFATTNHASIEPIENIAASYGGMYPADQSTFNNIWIFNDTNRDTWFGCGFLGAGLPNGVPGYNNKTCYGLQVVYIRVYSISK